MTYLLTKDCHDNKEKQHCGFYEELSFCESIYVSWYNVPIIVIKGKIVFLWTIGILVFPKLFFLLR